MSDVTMTQTVLDCTLRDGGYHTAWHFAPDLVQDYLVAMKAAGVDVVELGFRFLHNRGFKGACAFTTDDFLRSLDLPEGLTVGVMLNAADLCTDVGCIPALERLFPETASTSPVRMVRMACHMHELPQAATAAAWLADRGFRVGVNLMQVSDRNRSEIAALTERMRAAPVDVLYVADSLGSMTPDDVARVTGWLRSGWDGPLGIHTHDNMGMALANTLRAADEGMTWLDATVTGMGRGPGNARTEELVIEMQARTGRTANLVPLMALIARHLGPMKAAHGWGTNPFYYLAGRHGIHPTYVQAMLGDPRYDEADILAVIDQLRGNAGKRFSADTLDGARRFYRGAPRGSWAPAQTMAGREVLILGTGPGVGVHRAAVEAHIRRARPLVVALNTQEAIDPALIDLRVACHPVRLLADAEAHARQPQPLVTPASMLPPSLRATFGSKTLLDFGLGIEPERFAFHDTWCVAPGALVLAYALAMATSGRAGAIRLAGFDGYPPGDPRNDEIEAMLAAYAASGGKMPVNSVTPSRYRGLESCSIHGL